MLSRAGLWTLPEIAQNEVHNSVHHDSELDKALHVSTTHSLNLDGSFAQMDASLGDTQLNRSSAPAPLTAKENIAIDYKMVEKRASSSIYDCS